MPRDENSSSLLQDGIEGDCADADDDYARDGEGRLQLRPGDISEAADSGYAVIEFGSHNRRPGEPDRDPDAGENFGQCGGQDDIDRDLHPIGSHGLRSMDPVGPQAAHSVDSGDRDWGKRREEK